MIFVNAFTVMPGNETDMRFFKCGTFIYTIYSIQGRVVSDIINVQTTIQTDKMSTYQSMVITQAPHQKYIASLISLYLKNTKILAYHY